MFGIITKTFCVGVGYLFPAYKCFKLLHKGPESISNGSSSSTDQQQRQGDVVKGILKYWIVMAGFTAVDFVLDTFAFWLPLTGLVKVTFVTFMVMPGLNGSEIFYDHVVEPYLVKNQHSLDKYFDRAQAVAERSSRQVSKSAYDRWAVYVQKIINRQTDEIQSVVQSSSTASQGTSSSAAADGSNESAGLTGLLKSASQKLPQQATAAASMLAGFSGITEGPTTQADTVGRSTFGTVLNSWITAFSSGSYTQVTDEERLGDIRSRKQQLQDMVTQLETSERGILERGCNNTITSNKSASEADDDMVIVNEPGNEGTSSASNANKDKDKDKSSQAASRRWFW